MIVSLMVLLCAAAPTARPPIAVMPFKDLTGTSELKWLSVGIAETMAVDLKKGSHLAVVERDQLDHALAELALQGLKSDESSAAKLGKMVGARTVVLGSYQKVEKELRIVARMVDVETGVVTDAAKVTGGIGDVFALQDAIVVKLAGTPVQDAARHFKSKPKKSVEAYRLYAMSFTAASDVERANLLAGALKEDPDFVYAAEDLFELQDRLKRFADAHHQAIDKQIAAFQKTARDASKPETERLTAAMQLLGAELGARRLHQVLRDSAWMLGSDLPDDEQYRIRAYAQFCRVSAYQQLHEQGLAMQAAETLMERYPGSPYFVGAQSLLASFSSQRARELEEERTYPARLEAKRQEIAKERAEARNVIPHRELTWQTEPCQLMSSGNQHADAEACYRAVLDHKLPAPELVERYRGLRLTFIREAIDARHFDLARREAGAFLKDDPDGALRMYVNLIAQSLPED